MVNLAKLNLQILVELNTTGGAITSALEIPTYRVEAATREQALKGLQALLAARLQDVKIFPVETVPQSNQSENPWHKIAITICAERDVDDETTRQRLILLCMFSQPNK